MKKIENIFRYRISYKLVLILLLACIGFLLVPLLLIAKCDVPSADDFSNGIHVHEVIKNGGSIVEVLNKAIEYTRNTYLNFQGTVSALFLFALQPAVFGEQYYVIVPYLMILSLISGSFLFIYRFFSAFAAKRTFSYIYPLITGCVVVIICTQFLPSPVEGFYWYTGAVFYTFFFGLSLILYAILIHLTMNNHGKGSVLYQILSIFLCMIIGFSNYVTSLLSMILIILFMIILLAHKNNRWKYLILPIIFLGASFYLNFSAPGNSVRQSVFTNRPGVIGTIWLSLQCTVTQLYQWNSLSVLMLYIFLLPVLLKIALESEYSFKLPWLVTLFSFGLQASMNCPTYYAYADPGPGRVENIRFFAMVILIVINMFYWEGWLLKKMSFRSGVSLEGMKLSFLLIIGMLFAGTLALSEKQPITSISAYKSYRSGDAGLYKHVFQQRLEILNDPETKDALLREFPVKPYVLFFDDISDDPEDWKNIAVRKYYHKDSVRLMNHEEFEEQLNRQ